MADNRFVVLNENDFDKDMNDALAKEVRELRKRSTMLEEKNKELNNIVKKLEIEKRIIKDVMDFLQTGTINETIEYSDEYDFYYVDKKNLEIILIKFLEWYTEK